MVLVVLVAVCRLHAFLALALTSLAVGVTAWHLRRWMRHGPSRRGLARPWG